MSGDGNTRENNPLVYNKLIQYLTSCVGSRHSDFGTGRYFVKIIFGLAAVFFMYVAAIPHALPNRICIPGADGDDVSNCLRGTEGDCSDFSVQGNANMMFASLTAACKVLGDQCVPHFLLPDTLPLSTIFNFTALIIVGNRTLDDEVTGNCFHSWRATVGFAVLAFLCSMIVVAAFMCPGEQPQKYERVGDDENDDVRPTQREIEAGVDVNQWMENNPSRVFAQLRDQQLLTNCQKSPYPGLQLLLSLK